MATEMNEKTRGLPNTVVGIVVSDKMDKTITVEVSRMVKHKRYGKYIRRSSKFMAHDEANSAKAGDKVLITETRKLSKNKNWKLSKIVEEAKL